MTALPDVQIAADGMSVTYTERCGCRVYAATEGTVHRSLCREHEDNDEPGYACLPRRFVPRMKACRRAANLTLNEIAERLDKPLEEVRDIERGRTPIGISECIAWTSACGRPLGWLFGNVPEEASQ